MEQKLIKGAIAFFIAVFLLAILWPYQPKLIDWDLEPNYEVQEHAELFFNNTRITAYRTEESEALQEQGFKVHRSAKAVLDTTQPLVNYAIINHWRADRAYIIAEPNASSRWGEQAVLAFADTSLTVDWLHMDFEDHYRLAAQLFQAQLDNERIWLVGANDSTLLFGTQGNESANRTVLRDYFRLIGRYR